MPDVVSIAPAYRPAAEERPRDPVLAEWALRGAIALALFAGFFAFGKSTAPAGEGGPTPTVAVSASTPVPGAALGLAGSPPLERAVAERARLERAEVERAEAAARAKRKTRRPAASGSAFARAEGASVAGAVEGATIGSAKSSPVTTPAASAPRKSTSPASLPRRPSSSSSSGAGTSFDSSG